MQKFFKLVLSATFFLASAGFGFAETLKVGCVDMIEVFNNYKRTQELEDGLTKKAEDYKNKRDAKIEEIKKLRDSIALLSDAARDKKQAELEKKADELRAFENENVRNIQRERDAMRREILDELEARISAYAQANGYDLVVYRNIAAYFRPEMDLTGTILQTLNDSYKKKR